MKLDILPDLLLEHPLDDENPWYVVVDPPLIERRFTRLRDAFPDWLHAVAVKAHPLESSLRRLVDLGAGMEAASFGEVELALDAGCPPDRIVFDSPAKTRRELANALELGVLINADNLTELERIDELLAGSVSASVGLRINPEVAPSSIGALSTGVRNSKFGVSLSAQRDAVFDAFDRWPWLDGLHVHIGSKGYGPDELAAGIARVVTLAEELDVGTIDIGGGLPSAVTPGAYREALEKHAPALFTGEMSVVTEFGRWLFTHAAVVISRVEYVKPAADVDIATIHFGADFMLRNAYQPGVWHHPIEVFHPDGTRKFGGERPTTVAGPLCFGGDVIAVEVELPGVSEGDIIAVRDVGAYTFGMWSEFCSRPKPKFVLL